MLERKGPILHRITKTLIALMSGFLQLTKATNILAAFPESLNIHKSDIVGFKIENFVNGTMTNKQVFPQPTIQKSPSEERIHTFESPSDQSSAMYCGKADSVIPLEYVLLCSSLNQQVPDSKLQSARTVVVYQKFDEDMKLIAGKEYFIELQSEAEKITACDHVKVIKEGTIFVSCYLRKPDGGDFDAVLYALTPDITGGKYTLKVAAKKIYESFVGKDVNKDDKGSILTHHIVVTTVKTSDDNYRVSLHQMKYPEHANINTSDNVLIVDYSVKSPSFTEKFKGKFSISGTQNVAFASDDWIYCQSSKDRSFSVCQISKADKGELKCSPSVSLDNSPLSIFTVNYDYKTETKRSTFFFAGSKEYSRCNFDLTKNNHPFDLSKADCKKLKLSFSTEEIADLMGGDMRIDESEEDAIITYYSKKLEKNTNLAGYLKASSYNYRAQFMSLRHSQASYLSPINSTYYILHRGKLASIHERSRERFFLRAPEGEKSANVYLSAYSPALNEEPFVVNTKVNRVESENEGLEAEKIQEITIYEQDFEGIYPPEKKTENKRRVLFSITDGDQRVPCHFIGINSKLIKGNNLKIKGINLGYKKSDGTEEYAKGKDLEFIQKNKNLYQMMKVSGDKNDKKTPSGEAVPELKIDFSFKTQDKIKGYFSADDGLFLFQTETDKIYVIICEVETFFTKEIKCKTILETTSNKYDVKEIYYHKEKLYVIAKQRSGTKTELFAYNKQMELFIAGKDNTDKKTINNGAVISEADIDLDIEIFSDDIFIVSVQDEDTDKKIPAKVVLTQFIINHEKLANMKSYELILNQNGVPHFKKSGVKFFGGQTQFAYIVNAHNKDFSIIKVLYGKVASGFPLIIHEKFSIRYADGKKPTDDKSKISLCLTLNSVFVFNDATKYLYGATLDAPSGSFLTVPLGDETAKAEKKAGRTVESMYCSPNHESFQLIVKDDSKTDSDRYMITYFDFDGSQASKKVHSAVLLPHAKSSVLTSSISDKRRNFLLSLVYSYQQGIGSADPFLINLNGPFISLCLNKYYYEVDFKTEIQPGLEKEKKWSPEKIAAEKKKYTETPTLFRRGTTLNLLKITFMTDDKNTVDAEIGFKLKGIEQTKGRFKELVAIPSSPPKNEKLSSYITSTGPVFEVRVKSSLTKAIKIKQKLEIIDEGKTGIRKPWSYMEKSIILDTIGDIVLVNEVTTNRVILYKQIKEVRHIFDLKDTKKYGIDCRNFKLISLGRTVYVNFVCERDLDSFVTISSFEIHEGTNEATFIKKLPFDVQELKFANNDDYIFIAMKELNGNELRVWRIERKRGDLSEIKVKSRVPGDLSLFPYSIFDIISVKSTTILTVLSPGQNFFRVMSVDFQQLSLKHTKVVYSQNRTSIYYQGFGSCPSDEPCIIGVAGGDGVEIHEYNITVDEKTKLIGDVKVTQIFQKFFTEKLFVEEIIPLEDYYLFTGKFGQMEVSEEAVKENEVPKENKSPSPPTPSPASSTRILPETQNLKSGAKSREIYHLIYKRGEPEVFMRGYGDDKHGSLQKDKDGYIYVASEDNSIKYYRIQPFSITEDTSVSRSGDDKKPKLILYSYKKANEPSVYLSMKDVSESFFYQSIAILFIVGVIFLCVITYRIAKQLDKNPKYAVKKDKILFQIEEVDKRFTDQKIIEDYFGEKRTGNIGSRAGHMGRVANVGYEEDKLDEEKNLAGIIEEMKEDDEKLIEESDDDLGFLSKDDEKEEIAGSNVKVEVKNDSDSDESSDAE